MKWIILLFVVVFHSYLFSSVVDYTATMDSVLVENLREAVDSDGINDDEVMDFYYEKINPYDGRDDGEDEEDWRENRADYETINKFSIFNL